MYLHRCRCNCRATLLSLCICVVVDAVVDRQKDHNVDAEWSFRRSTITSIPMQWTTISSLYICLIVDAIVERLKSCLAYALVAILLLGYSVNANALSGPFTTLHLCQRRCNYQMVKRSSDNYIDVDAKWPSSLSFVIALLIHDCHSWPPVTLSFATTDWNIKIIFLPIIFIFVSVKSMTLW